MFIIIIISFWSKLSLYFDVNWACLSRPRYPKRVLYSLVTIPGTLDTCIYKLRDTDTPFLHFCGTKKTKFFWAKIFEKFQKMWMAPIREFEQFSVKLWLPRRTFRYKFYDSAGKSGFRHSAPAFICAFPNTVKNGHFDPLRPPEWFPEGGPKLFVRPK